MGANDLGANVQAQSQAISTRGHGMAPERLEDLSQTFRWDERGHDDVSLWSLAAPAIIIWRYR